MATGSRAIDIDIDSDCLSVSGQDFDSNNDEGETTPAPKKQKSISKKSAGKSKAAKFQTHWSLPPHIASSSKGNTYAYCQLCSSHFSVSHGGYNDVTRHVSGSLHQQRLKDSSQTASISSFFRKDAPAHTQAVTSAEVRMVQFIARHNISFQTADHLSQLFPVLFPDSKIAASFGCGHTKTKAICCDLLDPYFKKPVVETAMNLPFSLLCDESNDKGAPIKLLTILVRFYDAHNGCVATRHLETVGQRLTISVVSIL